jgi:hypothetical protein
LLVEIPGDNEVVKELKGIYRIKDHKDIIPDFLDSASGGVSYLIFILDLLKDYYLKSASDYINNKLVENNVKINELDKDK